MLYSKWDSSKKSYHLIQYIMPQEDIDYIKVLKRELDNLESFDFENFAKQYELKNFIISIVYIDQIETRILSKIKINMLHHHLKMVQSELYSWYSVY